MATTTINTSKAKDVPVNLKNYDSVPLSLVINEVSGGTKTPKDLTAYRFDFYLKKNGADIKTYTLDAGDLSSDYLSKTGDDNEFLNTQSMWENIQTIAKPGADYRLVWRVTQPDGLKFVYINFIINAGQY